MIKVQGGSSEKQRVPSDSAQTDRTAARKVTEVYFKGRDPRNTNEIIVFIPTTRLSSLLDSHWDGVIGAEKVGNSWENFLYRREGKIFRYKAIRAGGFSTFSGKRDVLDEWDENFSPDPEGGTDDRKWSIESNKLPFSNELGIGKSLQNNITVVQAPFYPDPPGLLLTHPQRQFLYCEKSVGDSPLRDRLREIWLKGSASFSRIITASIVDDAGQSLKGLSLNEQTSAKAFIDEFLRVHKIAQCRLPDGSSNPPTVLAVHDYFIGCLRFLVSVSGRTRQIPEEYKDECIGTRVESTDDRRLNELRGDCKVIGACLLAIIDDPEEDPKTILQQPKFEKILHTISRSIIPDFIDTSGRKSGAHPYYNILCRVLGISQTEEIGSRMRLALNALDELIPLQDIVELSGLSLSTDARRLLINELRSRNLLEAKICSPNQLEQVLSQLPSDVHRITLLKALGTLHLRRLILNDKHLIDVLKKFPQEEFRSVLFDTLGFTHIKNKIVNCPEVLARMISELPSYCWSKLSEFIDFGDASKMRALLQNAGWRNFSKAVEEVHEDIRNSIEDSIELIGLLKNVNDEGTEIVDVEGKRTLIELLQCCLSRSITNQDVLFRALSEAKGAESELLNVFTSEQLGKLIPTGEELVELCNKSSRQGCNLLQALGPRVRTIISTKETLKRFLKRWQELRGNDLSVLLKSLENIAHFVFHSIDMLEVAAEESWFRRDELKLFGAFPENTLPKMICKEQESNIDKLNIEYLVQILTIFRGVSPSNLFSFFSPNLKEEGKDAMNLLLKSFQEDHLRQKSIIEEGRVQDRIRSQVVRSSQLRELLSVVSAENWSLILKIIGPETSATCISDSAGLGGLLKLLPPESWPARFEEFSKIHNGSIMGLIARDDQSLIRFLNTIVGPDQPSDSPLDTLATRDRQAWVLETLSSKKSLVQYLKEGVRNASILGEVLSRLHRGFFVKVVRVVERTSIETVLQQTQREAREHNIDCSEWAKDRNCLLIVRDSANEIARLFVIRPGGTVTIQRSKIGRLSPFLSHILDGGSVTDRRTIKMLEWAKDEALMLKGEFFNFFRRLVSREELEKIIKDGDGLSSILTDTIYHHFSSDFFDLLTKDGSPKEVASQVNARLQAIVSDHVQLNGVLQSLSKFEEMDWRSPEDVGEARRDFLERMGEKFAQLILVDDSPLVFQAGSEKILLYFLGDGVSLPKNISGLVKSYSNLRELYDMLRRLKPSPLASQEEAKKAAYEKDLAVFNGYNIRLLVAFNARLDEMHDTAKLCMENLQNQRGAKDAVRSFIEQQTLDILAIRNILAYLSKSRDLNPDALLLQKQSSTSTSPHLTPEELHLKEKCEQFVTKALLVRNKMICHGLLAYFRMYLLGIPFRWGLFAHITGLKIPQVTRIIDSVNSALDEIKSGKLIKFDKLHEELSSLKNTNTEIEGGKGAGWSLKQTELYQSISAAQDLLPRDVRGGSQDDGVGGEHWKKLIEDLIDSYKSASVANSSNVKVLEELNKELARFNRGETSSVNGALKQAIVGLPKNSSKPTSPELSPKSPKAFRHLDHRNAVLPPSADPESMETIYPGSQVTSDEDERKE